MKPFNIQMHEFAVDGTIIVSEKIVKLRKQIEEIFNNNNGQKINLFFTGVEKITNESAHQLVGKLAIKYSPVRVESYVNVVHSNNDITETVMRAIEYANQNDIE